MMTKEKPVKCPLCEKPLTYIEWYSTHLYRCNECPFTGLEFIEDEDIKHFTDNILNFR